MNTINSSNIINNIIKTPNHPNDTKQVIVVRKDLTMRKGKIVAQSCHASNNVMIDNWFFVTEALLQPPMEEKNMWRFSILFREWLQHGHAKICVYVESEAELLALRDEANKRHIMNHLILDSGRTEFNNVPTHTVLALGPAREYEFVGLTDHLKLL